MSLVIVDTGVANLASVGFAFERLGVKAVITDHAETIKSSERVIIPGIGASTYAMQQIIAKGLVPILQSLTQPVMGICLGMQILFETLEEGSAHSKDQAYTHSLGLIPGDVTKLNTQDLPSPHMGWNILTRLKDDPIIDGIGPADRAYFVHSYAAKISGATLMQTTYGTPFSAIVRHKNIYGCQFHPERSSHVGARILSNFMRIPL